MKKFFMVALIGLAVASCTKDDDLYQANRTLSESFQVETLTKYSHKFPHRGNVPLKICDESYTLLSKEDYGKGLIVTNYGDIPLQFPYAKGLKISSRMITETLTFDDPFPLHGGYIELTFSVGDEIIKTDSVRFDIIATQDKIDEWAHGIHK